MKEKLLKIENAIFGYDGKVFKVLETKVVNGKAVIKTDKRTFVFLETELNEFWSGINIFESGGLVIESKISQAVIAEPQSENWIPNKNTLPLKESPHKVEIMQANALSVRMIDKLENVFNELAESPGEEVYKKADAMVKAANAIVNVQVASLKYLMLNK